MNKIAISTYLSIITLNINGLKKALNNDKRSLQEEDITFANIYAPNIGAPKYIKQILTDLKGEIDKNGQYIIIKGTIYQENSVIDIYMYV